MSSPDYRNDPIAFIRDFLSPEVEKMTQHHQSILNAALNSQQRKRKDYRDEPVFFGADLGKPGGDQTAYVRYTYSDFTIHIEDVTFEELYGSEPKRIPGGRPSIAELVARIGEKQCTCTAGYLFNLETLQLTVCTQCDGFSTQRRRRFR